MKIIVVTQNAPLYVSSFLDDFFALINKSQHSIEGVVVLSPLFKNSIFKEVKDRYNYYGCVDFCKFAFKIAKSKLPFSCFSVRKVMAKYGLKECKINSINSSEFVNYIKNTPIDLVISVASPQIFKSNLLTAPQKGCINYHSALLPKYRGRQPLFWALLNREKEVGISIHEMDEKLDNGPIIVQERIVVCPDESLNSLYLKTIKIGPKALIKAIDTLDNNSKKRITNDENQASYYGFPAKKDAKIFKTNGGRFF